LLLFFCFDFYLVLFGSEGTVNFSTLTAQQAAELYKDAPQSSFPRSEVLGQPFSGLLLRSGACKSKGEAKRILAAGGVTVNNNKVSYLFFFFSHSRSCLSSNIISQLKDKNCLLLLLLLLFFINPTGDRRWCSRVRISPD
jgi:tyrosyl-tRNA synthetase